MRSRIIYDAIFIASYLEVVRELSIDNLLSQDNIYLV
jgi:hypothetical protein